MLAPHGEFRVTLKGSTNSEADQAQAESIAECTASSQVIANETSVRTNDQRRAAKTVDKDTDKGIEKDLDAALAKNKL